MAKKKINDDGWIKTNLPYGHVYGKKDWSQLDSFCKRGLNQPGTLIKMKNGDQYLIGDINELRGVCDDCTAFEKDNIVVGYKIIYQK